MSTSDAFDVEAYLERIGMRSAGKPTLATLTALHEAHVRSIPFENLDIALGRPIRLDLESLTRKIVTDRRGGYCFEQNTLFGAALRALGFTVTRLEARVRRAPDVPAARTHLLLRVALPEGPFVADVGFGAGGLFRPLPLVDGASDERDGGGNALFRRGDRWVVATRTAEGLQPCYDFNLEPPDPIDLEVANHYTSSHPDSGFVRRLTAQRLLDSGWAVLRDRELSIGAFGAAAAARVVASPEELLDILASTFGLAFPAGTRFRVPSFDDAVPASG